MSEAEPSPPPSPGVPGEGEVSRQSRPTCVETPALAPRAILASLRGWRTLGASAEYRERGQWRLAPAPPPAEASSSLLRVFRPVPVGVERARPHLLAGQLPQGDL